MGATGAMFVVLAGATYQGVVTALERRQFPHPGRLVDVGDHQLHLHCTGEGKPAVVLEAPALGISEVWGWVQPGLSSLTRVCSYDRAGLGWSEAGDFGYDPSRAIDQLHVLLERASELPPYVLVGDGFGAALATGYADRYRSDLTALILIDQPTQAANGARPVGLRFAGAWPWLARAGVLRGTDTVSGLAEGLPDASAGAFRAFLNRPDHLTRAASELARWDDTVRLAASARLDPGLRVLRLDNGNRPVGAFRLNNRAQARAASSAIARVIAAARIDP
jgi:pimeloyl-ACP methyl ester carboxylesterase